MTQQFRCYAFVAIVFGILGLGCSDRTPPSVAATAGRRVDLASATVQVVKTHGLVLPEGEGYDEFEVFLPAAETRWAYLIAGNDESLGPLTGHFVLESRRRITADSNIVEWSVRAWRYKHRNTNVAGGPMGEARALVPLKDQAPLRHIFCDLWDKPSRTSPVFNHGAPVQWSIYLYDKAGATGAELRTDSTSSVILSTRVDHNN